MAHKLDQEAMRQQNRKLVLQALFNEAQTSRSEIAEKISLHKSTVTTIYKDLEREHFIEELGEGTVSKVGGRKPQLIRFNRDYGFVVSFDLGRKHIRFLAARLTGEILTHGRLTIDDSMGYEEVKRALLQYVLQLGDLGTVNGLVGIGIGIHGVVNDNKVTYTPFNPYLVDHDLATELQIALDVPVYLENEANLAAIYVRDFQDRAAGNNLTDFVVINIHNGIGSGIIQAGRLERGQAGQAGELGRMVLLNQDEWIEKGYQKPVHLEDLYSEDALLMRAEKIKGQAISRRELVAMYEENETDIVNLLDSWAKVMGQTLFNLAQYAAVKTFFVHSRIIASIPALFDKMHASYCEALPQPVTKLSYAGNSVYASTLNGSVAHVTRKLLDLEGYELHFTISEVGDETWD